MEDSEELFVRFMNTFQDQGDKPSAYLQRLQAALNLTVRRGGVPVEEVGRHLLKQFCRGCWDENLLADLQLERRKHKPPPFAELLMLLRTAEERQETKSTRMRRHLGVTRQKAVSHVQAVHEAREISANNDSKDMSELKKQVAELKNQIATLAGLRQPVTRKDPKKRPELKKPDQTNAVIPTQTTRDTPPPKPKPWYCFHCGEDGHVAATCESDPNPDLVAAKRKELRMRRQM